MRSPIVDRQPDEVIAWLTHPLNGLELKGTELAITVTQFLNHVALVSDMLPPHSHTINLCDNRYVFMVCLCASLANKNTILLPPNKNTATQEQLANKYENSLIVYDDSCDISDKIDCFDVSLIDWRLDETPVSPSLIEFDHLALIAFTSGSTGQSKPNLKYWRTIVESSRINAEYMLLDQSKNYANIATVPGQHMWGLETSVLLAMFSNTALVDARPFFPQDIIKLVNTLPSPCRLISTPFHLKMLNESLEKMDNKNRSKVFSHLQSILCATAPLDADLAKKLEQHTGSEIREVYGCSEVGSMAVRKTAQQTAWTPFNGLEFEAHIDSNGESTTTVQAAHLAETVHLEDRLSFQDTQYGPQFHLAGRNSDQINIAGKRGSLSEVNSILNSFEYLKDGVVMFPEQSRSVPRLAAVVVLHNQGSTKQLKAHMAKYLDAAFVPRPIFEVDTLPREENGKLSKSALNKLYKKLTLTSNK